MTFAERTDFQPRYLAYCAAHGRDPKSQLANDDQEWPGGVMCGYILWITDQWASWKREVKWPRGAPIFQQQHEAFDEWLRNRILSAHPRPKGPPELTQGESALHHPAPECEGEIAARESLEPEGPRMPEKATSDERTERLDFAGGRETSLTESRE